MTTYLHASHLVIMHSQKPKLVLRPPRSYPSSGICAFLWPPPNPPKPPPYSFPFLPSYSDHLRAPSDHCPENSLIPYIAYLRCFLPSLPLVEFLSPPPFVLPQRRDTPSGFEERYLFPLFPSKAPFFYVPTWPRFLSQADFSIM